ncbi:MAG: hypothetical protein JST00_29760 [Deltaproteobacteria bacterium]|nr:hypothetical protein [Deltaproteobacteria bacterium]
MSHRSAFFACSFVALITACGSSEPEQPAAQAGTPNQQGASQTSTSTISSLQVGAKQGATGADGQGSAQQLQSVASAMQNLVTPQQGNTGAAQQGLTLFPMENLTGVCNCTATSCTFEGCGNGTTFKMDGSYSWGGGAIKAALKYTVNSASAGANAQIVMQLDADVKITETTIDGTVSSKGTTNSSFGGFSATSSWDASMTYTGVTFPKGGGAPTAGKASVKATQTTAGVGGASGATYAADFEINFPYK